MRQQLIRSLSNPREFRAMWRNKWLSFSQYGEDHMIDVLLRPGPTGTYVDVGSHHPYEGSNTYGLYLRGWRGLTVDANPIFTEAYAKWRPDEPHLVAGVSDKPGALTYHAYENTVYNTLSDQRASDLADGGIVARDRVTIETKPLAEMVDAQLHGRPIDLLSVDCEGLDLEVIRSLDVARHRPTVIIMEDYARLVMFREGRGESQLHAFLTGIGYAPFAQLAFSALYIANDYRELMQRSAAFDPARIQGGILS